ncbi:hypothetical protein L1887_17928 [Cichorium endivia]|nr:hypothetical protein L1887_17928 [Cichorium endivia]
MSGHFTHLVGNSVDQLFDSCCPVFSFFSASVLFPGDDPALHHSISPLLWCSWLLLLLPSLRDVGPVGGCPNVTQVAPLQEELSRREYGELGHDVMGTCRLGNVIRPPSPKYVTGMST